MEEALSITGQECSTFFLSMYIGISTGSIIGITVGVTTILVGVTIAVIVIVVAWKSYCNRQHKQLSTVRIQ